MSMQNEKQVIYENLAQIAQSIGHASRLELLEYIAQGAKAVEDLVALCGLSFANTSRHLQILRRARIIDANRLGKRIFYSLNNDDRIVNLLSALSQVGEHNNAEISNILNSFYQNRETMQAISRDELNDRLKDHLVTIIDVRPPQEFAAGHISGAINIPLNELEAQIQNLKSDKEIIAYCRGPYCVLALDAVRLLKEHGLLAMRLSGGFPEWKAEGRAIEKV